jgi:hypothetical protein
MQCAISPALHAGLPHIPTCSYTRGLGRLASERASRWIICSLCIRVGDAVPQVRSDSAPLDSGHHRPSVPSSRKRGGVSYGETDSTISMIIFHYATGSFFPPAGVACAGNHVLRWGLAPWAHAQEAGFTRSRAWTSLQDQSREYVSLKRSAAAKAAQCCRARLDGTRIQVARTCLLHRATDPRGGKNDNVA